MKLSEKRVGFLGFGHMAQTLCLGFARAKLIPRSQITFVQRDTHKSKENEKRFGVTASSLEGVVRESDFLILAVRPNQVEILARDLIGTAMEQKGLVSLIAGLKLERVKELFPRAGSYARVMPNLASEVGEGMTTYTLPVGEDASFASAVHLLFASSGQALQISEALMDAAAAVAGSGPGFVFRMIEAAARFAENEGFLYPDALKMAAQAFLGASKLILSGHLPPDLVRQIATPNGMTEAGLRVMDQTRIEESIQKTLAAAMERSKTLATPR
ncbi:MAG: hypothetical protein RL235_558 [Chlamydiota bacterium]|jgi:pyrroline-5-carboxylate reductase